MHAWLAWLTPRYTGSAVPDVLRLAGRVLYQALAVPDAVPAHVMRSSMLAAQGTCAADGQ